MYYHIKTANILSSLPINAYDNNQTLVQNLPFASIETKADCGYYTIKQDFPEQPREQSFENVAQRIVSIEYPYVSITRTWITPEITE